MTKMCMIVRKHNISTINRHLSVLKAQRCENTRGGRTHAAFVGTDAFKMAGKYERPSLPVKFRICACMVQSKATFLPCRLAYTVSKNKISPSFINRSMVKHCSILINFGRNIPEKMHLDGVILFLTSPNWRYCTTWENNLK